MTDSTKRFSDRVEDYIKYRPHYPQAVIDTLRAECGLDENSIVADIGAGTGILSELFLRNGNAVYAVEPNPAMRAAAERTWRENPHFHSVDGTAEATALAVHAVDFVTAGQSFHWFDSMRARAEFARILRPGGWVMLIWNSRRSDATPFLHAYEQILQTYAIDYSRVDHRLIDHAVFVAFFGAQGLSMKHFANRQHFGWDGVKGRLLSSSYTPGPGHPQHAPMLAALEAVFQTYQVDDKVTFEYDTEMYYGQLA